MDGNEAFAKTRDGREEIAVREIADRLVKLGVNPDVAKECADQARDRLFVGGPKSPIFVLQSGTLGGFMPGSYEDPLGGLVSEVFNGISDEYKLVAVKRNEKEIAELTEDKARRTFRI
jgi:hypothetical protein